MKTFEFKTPFAKLHVLRNGNPVEFEIEPLEKEPYLEIDNRYPDGLYRVTVDTNMYKLGDIIKCEFDKGYLEPDGGGENMLNVVGTIDKYTVGMGTYDTDYHFKNEKLLPYEFCCFTNRGFEFHIIDNPIRYKYMKGFQEMYFDIAWMYGTTDKDWNIISFVTTIYH